MTIITSLVRTDRNLWNRIEDGESAMARPVIQLSSLVCVRVLRSLCCTVGDDTQTGPPWRCVAVTTITRQAEICVLYTDVIEPLPQNCIIIPSECDRSTLSREPVPTGAGRSSNRAGGRHIVAETIIVHYCVDHADLSSSPHPLFYTKRTHTHTHTRAYSFALSLSIFASYVENRILGRRRNSV